MLGKKETMLDLFKIYLFICKAESKKDKGRKKETETEEERDRENLPTAEASLT